MDNKLDILSNPIDKNNEASILSNAIKSAENREIFYRNVSYNKFRLKEFQTIAWGILEVMREGLEVNIDAILLKSKTCPVRYLVEFDFLSEIVKNFDVVPTKNFSAHIEKLLTDYVKAAILDKALSSLYPTCLSSKTTLKDVDERISYLKTILETGYSASQLGFKSLNVLATEFEEAKLQNIDKRTCGFAQLDNLLTEGLKEGQISIVAALPGVGKSSFVLSMMKNLSNFEVPAAQFALEMNSMSLFTKLMAFNTRLPISKIIRKYDYLTPTEKAQYDWELKRLAENKHIFLNDKPSQSISSIREQIMLLQDFLKTQYIFICIDLFGKIGDLQGSDNFARDYEEKLNALQIIVRELGVHMMLVAQIQRKVAYRKNKRPTMADLKNAGALEEVADIIFGIHRPFYDQDLALKVELAYGSITSPFPNEEEDDSEYTSIDDHTIQEDQNAHIAEIILLKQRMGRNNVLVNFTFDPITTCFIPIDESCQHLLNQTKLSDGDLS